MKALSGFAAPGNAGPNLNGSGGKRQNAMDIIQPETIQNNSTTKEGEDRSLQYQEQLRELSARLQSVREEECSRIAREIHDDLGQAMTSLKMDIAWITRNMNSQTEQALRTKLREMSDLVDTTIQSVRRISTGLRPPVLDDIGLVAALEWHVQEFERRTHIPCKLTCSLEESSLQGEAATAVFRIFQETLTNVARHAQATQVSALLEETGGRLLLHVHDNGRGITPQEIDDPRSIGLLGMKERARSHGGWVKIRGAQNGGTDVDVVLPLDHNHRQWKQESFPK